MLQQRGWCQVYTGRGDLQKLRYMPAYDGKRNFHLQVMLRELEKQPVHEVLGYYRLDVDTVVYDETIDEKAIYHV